MPHHDDIATWRRFILPALLAIAAMLALLFDAPAALAIQHWKEHPTVRAYLGYFDMFEPFGHGWGLLIVLIAIHQLDPSRRWAIPRVLGSALAAGGLADLLKMLVVRHRPHSLPADFSGSVWDTFGHWLPMLSHFSGGQSFPSAHTAMACGLAAGLIWLYPQGRFFFTAWAVLVGCQRIVSGAHFPSDVLLGAAAGCVVGISFFHVGRIPTWFQRWEVKWRAVSRAE